jgi:hypothetical protein
MKSASLKFSKRVYLLGHTIVVRPADLADKRPLRLSSRARAELALILNLSNANKNISGAGFFLITSFPVAVV